MNKFTNPLDNIKIASPCPANWNEMYGDERKRFCSECKLNVYNLSDMTRLEAENFLINAEGRVCIKFYRRSDGTVLTKDCPVGWQAVKKQFSRAAKAFASICVGILGGIFTFNQFRTTPKVSDKNFTTVNKKVQDKNSVNVNEVESIELPTTLKVLDKEIITPDSIKRDSNEKYVYSVGMWVVDSKEIKKTEIKRRKKHRR